MTIKETVWHPDTCTNPSCIMVYSWDTDLPDNLRVHTFVRADRICSVHQSLLTESLAYTTALGDNQRKNKVDGLLRDNITSIVDTALDGTKTYKNGISFNWSFSGDGANRVLTVSISGANLTNNQKNTIQNLADTLFGVGKVIVS